MNQKKKVSNFGEKKFRKLAKPSGMELYNSKPQGKKNRKKKRERGGSIKLNLFIIYLTSQLHC